MSDDRSCADENDGRWSETDLWKGLWWPIEDEEEAETTPAPIPPTVDPDAEWEMPLMIGCDGRPPRRCYWVRRDGGGFGEA